jgi:membrane-bound lytic murein transglycosylase D
MRRATTLALLATAAGTGPAAASDLYVLARNELSCSPELPCPPQLQRRVDFWISVFAEHGADKLVLHDSDQPERVFSVLTTEAGCSRRRPATVVVRERRRIQEQLSHVASTLGKAGEADWTVGQRHLAGLFPGESAAEIRAAAGRIRCQEGNRDRFLEGLRRYGQYRDMVVRHLREAGLPTDLQYLPFVESAYNPEARSHVGAAGLWQIMPRTGRTLGLAINSTLDERLDPEIATRAAARYLSDSRDALGPLARRLVPGVSEGAINPFIVTSYNYGQAGMSRAMREHGPSFIEVLERYRGRSFRVAVKNFYASFLAARHVAQNAVGLFGSLAVDPPLLYAKARLEAAASAKRLEDHFAVSRESLQGLNPALSVHVWAGRRPVPAGYELRLPWRQGGWDAEIAALRALPAETLEMAESQYRVERGDTACGIARRHGVSCRELIDENALGRRALIRVGQLLTIPGRIVRPEPDSPRSSPGAGPAAPGSGGQYRVARGDTACRIATRHGVSCTELIRENGLGVQARIYPGQILKLPGSQAASTAEYQVRRGDTPCAIARRHNVSCDALLSANGLSRRSPIYVGQTLSIP